MPLRNVRTVKHALGLAFKLHNAQRLLPILGEKLVLESICRIQQHSDLVHLIYR